MTKIDQYYRVVSERWPNTHGRLGKLGKRVGYDTFFTYPYLLEFPDGDACRFKMTEIEFEKEEVRSDA